LDLEHSIGGDDGGRFERKAEVVEIVDCASNGGRNGPRPSSNILNGIVVKHLLLSY